MSSKLKSKMKKKAVGFTKSEFEEINEINIRKLKYERIVRTTYHSLHALSMHIIELLYGYKKKRLEKFEDSINGLLAMRSEGTLTTDQLILCVNERCCIDLYKEGEKIPFREKLKLSRERFPKNQKQALIVKNCVNGAYVAWCSMACFVLKEVFKLSKRQIRQFLDKLADWVNSYYLGYLDDNDIDTSLDILYEETGYKSKMLKDVINE